MLYDLQNKIISYSTGINEIINANKTAQVLLIFERYNLYQKQRQPMYRYVHEVLVNRLGGLSLPRKSVYRLSDRPDMTLDVYCGRKTTSQQQQQADHTVHVDRDQVGNAYFALR